MPTNSKNSSKIENYKTKENIYIYIYIYKYIYIYIYISKTTYINHLFQ